MEKLNLMKEFLSVQGRKLLIQISICTIIIIGMFINYDVVLSAPSKADANGNQARCIYRLFISSYMRLGNGI